MNRMLTKTEFSTYYTERLLKLVENLKVHKIDKLEIEMEFEGSVGYKHFLNNCYTNYLNNPEELEDILNTYLKSSITSYLPKSEIKTENILPIIKDYRFLEEVKRLSSDFENNHLYEKYNDELYIFYAQDTETSINYLTKEDFENLNISLSEIKAIAIENLNNLLSVERHGENGYYMLTAGGNYESSIILLDIWNKNNFPVNGEIIIGIPSRDLLIITGDNDLENKSKLIDFINEINETGDHIVSDKLFKLVNGKFEHLK